MTCILVVNGTTAIDKFTVIPAARGELSIFAAAVNETSAVFSNVEPEFFAGLAL